MSIRFLKISNHHFLCLYVMCLNSKKLVQQCIVWIPKICIGAKIESKLFELSFVNQYICFQQNSNQNLFSYPLLKHDVFFDGIIKQQISCQQQPSTTNQIIHINNTYLIHYLLTSVNNSLPIPHSPPHTAHRVYRVHLNTRRNVPLPIKHQRFSTCHI